MSGPLLEGKVAVISGSTRGIGRAMADAFAAEGARVVVNGRRQEDADAVAAGIPVAVGIGGDLSPSTPSTRSSGGPAPSWAASTSWSTMRPFLGAAQSHA